MIEINLLPEGVKSRIQSKKQSASFAVDTKYVRFVMPSVLGLLLLVHVCLAVASVARNNQLRVLNAQWQKFEPERKVLGTFNKEYALSSADRVALSQWTKERVLWAEKLNKLSLDLPSGVWFTDISLTQKEMVLQGSVVSLQKEEMSLVKKLIDSLKQDQGFYGDFSNLALTSAQKETIGGYDVVNFVLVGTLKQK